MSGSASTWRTIRRVPSGWNDPPPRPKGPVPVTGDQVTRRGVFEGKRLTTTGKIIEVYARKGSCLTRYRWLARIRWRDGSRNEIRIEHLLPDRGNWIVVAQGKVAWSAAS